MRETLGPYRIIKKLGEGGMGVVYAAEDPRLGRSVALKTVRGELAGAEARERLRREARAAASISHPNICQLYEIGEHEGELFIAMELLDGESLADRIARGPLPVRDAVRVALDMLAALAALHRRGVLHRDLKPTNVFLTEHGAKLLDFGIARAADDAQRTQLVLTGDGMVFGTPRHMAPELASGGAATPSSDLFAVGAIIYEMLAGQPAFGGTTAVQVLHAVVYEQPPALTGSPIVVAVDRVLRRALVKQPQARYASADELAADLRLAADDSAPTGAAHARPMSRLIVLPFRLLRADPEVDFLAYSLADAVTASLSGLGSLVVRSTLTAGKFSGDAPDLQQIAREADVDVVLSGTLLRAGSQVRLSAQLAEAPGGALLWSHSMQVGFNDIFQLHDALVHSLVDALSLQLTAREHRLLGHDVPANAKAYEFFLRANEVGKEAAGWITAVGLYRQSVDLDPRYAPAWARLGRVYRLLAKYEPEDADANRVAATSALERALALNPDFSLAHNVVAQMDVDAGRAKDAMLRLLRQADHVADPDLFAGLCHACRYCGLLSASIAAHEHAIRLDPKARTSVVHTYFAAHDYDRVISLADPGATYIDAVARAELGRKDEALAILRSTAEKVAPRLRWFIEGTVSLIEGRKEDPEVRDAVERAFTRQVADPEGVYYAARNLARVGERKLALTALDKAVTGGYFCYPAFLNDLWLEPLRLDPVFAEIIARARERHEDATAAFKDAGGERIVGVRVS